MIPNAPLTEREQLVLDMLLKGATSQRVADALTISRKTVDKHRERIMLKYGVQKFVQLAGLLSSEMKPAEPASIKEIVAVMTIMQEQLGELQAQVQELLAAKAEAKSQTPAKTTSRVATRRRARAWSSRG